MATRQVQQLDNSLPKEVFTRVSIPSSATVTSNQRDLRPPPPLELPEPKPQTIYERNAIIKEKRDDATFGNREGLLLLLVLAPILICIFLILAKPSFVTENSSNLPDSNVKADKVILWTLIISVIVWILIYGFRFCKCIQK